MVRRLSFATVCLYRSASTCKVRTTRMRGSKGWKSMFNPEWKIPTRYSLTDWLVRNREMRRIENEEFDGKRANRVFYVCVLLFQIHPFRRSVLSGMTARSSILVSFTASLASLVVRPGLPHDQEEQLLERQDQSAGH